MPIYCDTRQFVVEGARAKDRRDRVPDGLAAMVVRVDDVSAFTNAIRYIALRGEPTNDTDFVRRAVEALKRLHDIICPDEGCEVSYVPDGDVHVTSAGTRVVHLHQEFLGVPVYDALRSVQFDRNGAVAAVTGDTVPVPARTTAVPVVSAGDAVLNAARHLGEHLAGKELKITGHAARVLARFPHPARPTVLHKAPFEDPITARLVLFYRGHDLRLGWLVRLQLPRGMVGYEVIVAADDPAEISPLLCRRTTAYAVKGNVFDFNPVASARQMRTFPRPASEYQLAATGAPAGFPWSWVDGDATSGNNAVSYRGGRRQTVKGARAGADIVFNPASASGTDQQQVNAFYICNFLHDFFYLLGFDEAVNFQKHNRSAQGKDDDNVIIRVFDSAITGMASMSPVDDGTEPTLKLGKHADRHTALDAHVVIHEFVHGVTNRLIGGHDHHDPLQGKEQSRAMGEGYSDYFAITIQNHYRRKAGLPESFAFGEWIGNNATKGLRPQSYDSTFTGTYGQLGRPGFIDAHDAGQIWGRALIGIHEVLSAARGGDAAAKDRADALGWQLVVDSLKVMVDPGANAPTLIHGRQAILKAFDDKVSSPAGIDGDPVAQRAAIDAHLTKMGIGPNARSPSAQYAGIVEDTGP